MTFIRQFSHLKWFVDQQTSIEVIEPLTLIIILTAIAISLVVFRYLCKLDIYCKFVHKAVAFTHERIDVIKLLVRFAFAFTIIYSFTQNHLLAPNVHIQNVELFSHLQTLSLVAATMVLLGINARFGSVLGVLFYGLSFLVAPPLEVLEHLEFLGLTLFILLAGGGKYTVSSNDRLQNFIESRNLHWHSRSVFLILSGISISLLAFSEKLFYLNGAEQFLNTHRWNLLSFIGVSDYWFIVLVGSAELLIGLSLILRIGEHLTIWIVAVTMLASMLALGPGEVAGHIFALPLLGIIYLDDQRPLSLKLSRDIS